MNIKRTWKIGAVALIVAAALVYSFLPKPIPVESAEIGRGVLEVTVQEDGKTRVKDRFEIIAPLAGRLLRVDLRPGYEVEAGKTQLAVIVPADPELMDARSRARAEADVKVAEAALDKAQDELARAERALELAQIELAKSERLFEEQYVTEDQVTRGRYDVKIREAERAAAEKGVRVARFNLEQARAALISAQGGDASVGFSILSPIDGKVFRVFRESEGFITFGEKIMELADPHNLEIAVDLLSKEAVHVKPGDPVRLEHWGGDEPLNGRVRLVEPSGFTKISALGVEEQRVNVIIDLVDPPEIWSRLGDGFRVEAGIVVWRGEDALLAPDSALFRTDEGWAVYRIEDGRARRTPVSVGRRNGLQAQILEGLAEGDMVIAHPGDQIADGVAVQPND